MTDPSLFRLRCTFRKQGRLALLSHLEIARALERAVRRADLPFAVSQGFSPHMKIAFGAALPVGVGGTCELFDLQMTNYIAPDKVLAALQAASVPDLMVDACEYIGPRDQAASVAFPISEYHVVLAEDPVKVVIPEEVHVIRKKKEKVLQPADFLVGDIKHAGTEISFALESKPTGSLRPDLLLKSCCDVNGQPLAIQTITRVAQRATREA